MPRNWGYSMDGEPMKIDEGLYKDAKTACGEMGKGSDYKCIWGMYRKNWERKHGKVLLNKPRSEGAGGE